YEHPLMERHLQETYGVMVYQEQVMRLAADLAGLSLGEADTLRKAMGKKDRELMAQQREKFISGCKANKIDARRGERIWDLIEKFAGYGFNKCLTGDSLVEMADGTQKPIVDIQDGDAVLTKDGPFRAVRARPSGVRSVGVLRLANGMSVRCTPDHPAFTQRGWVNAEDLRSEDFVSVARKLPSGSERVPDHYPALLGYALSEGSLGYDSHVYLYSSSETEIEDMAGLLSLFVNTVPRIEHRRDGKASSVRPARRNRQVPSEAVTFLFGDCGLKGAGALDKAVPELVDRWDERSVAVLVGKLFQGDGCVHRKTRSVFYATSSASLAAGVRRLLLKLGLSSTIHRKVVAYRGGERVGFTVNLIGGRSAYCRFQELVGRFLVGHKRDELAALADSYAVMENVVARGTVDVIPCEVCGNLLREAILKHYSSLKAGCRDLGISYRLLFQDVRKAGIRRDTLRYLAMRLDSPQLQALIESPMGWSRPRTFVVDGEEPTYDIEVPGARSFVANGIAVHNSHAACYALVAYQTAYLKANYPVEFMAALLTSEMDKTDKIVQYMEESRAMGLRVEAPDVNASRTQFNARGDTIHFGLGAIKNVGASAIDSVVRTRVDSGAFTSLDDFCARVDLRLLNRRVIESLIKAGAFDTIVKGRAGLLASLDQAMEAGQRRQRDREEGQVSLFEALGEPSATGKGVTGSRPMNVPEWPV